MKSSLFFLLLFGTPFTDAVGSPGSVVGPDVIVLVQLSPEEEAARQAELNTWLSNRQREKDEAQDRFNDRIKSERDETARRIERSRAEWRARREQEAEGRRKLDEEYESQRRREEEEKAKRRDKWLWTDELR